MTRATLSFLLGLAVLAVGLWAAHATAQNHARARTLDRRQREFEALRIATERLRVQLQGEAERLRAELEQGGSGEPQPIVPLVVLEGLR